MRQGPTFKQLLAATATILLLSGVAGIASFLKTQSVVAIGTGAGFGMLAAIPLALFVLINDKRNNSMLAILLLATLTLSACGARDNSDVQIANAIAIGEQARADGRVQEAAIALEQQKANEAAILEQQRIAADLAKAQAGARTEQERLVAVANQALANEAMASASVGVAEAEAKWKIVESQQDTIRQIDANAYKPWILGATGLIALGALWMYLDWKEKAKKIDQQTTLLLAAPRPDQPRATIVPIAALPEVPEYVRLVAREENGEAFQHSTIAGAWIVLCRNGRVISLMPSASKRLATSPQRMIAQSR